MKLARYLIAPAMFLAGLLTGATWTALRVELAARAATPDTAPTK